MALDLTQMISEIRTSKSWEEASARLGPRLQQLQDAVNQTASAAGVDSTQYKQQPDPPAKLNVKVAGEMAHVTVEDHSARSRSLHYFLHVSTNTAFSNPHVVHMGVSRGTVLNLPTNDDNGNPVKYYFRCHSMEPGSTKASDHVYHGQQEAPTAVQMSGSTNMTLLTSTGSGTNPTNGQKSRSGYGTPQFSNETVSKK